MAHNPIISTHLANIEANAAAPEFDSGYLCIYTGDQPENSGDPIVNEILLSASRFAGPAFMGPAVSGVLTANPLEPVQAINAGMARWFRCVKADGVTVLGDGECGLTGSGSDLELNSLMFDAGIEVSIASFLWRVRKK